MARYIREYPPEVRKRILAMLASGESQRGIERKEGIAVNTLRRWLNEARGKPSPSSAEVKVEHVESVGLPLHEADKNRLPEKSIVLALPDMHHPFVHEDALEFLRAVKRRFNPNIYVCLGDEADFAAFSRYTPDPDGMSPGKELERAIESLIPFYLEFPHMLVCESNHTVRPLKKLYEAGLPAAFLPTYAKMLNAPDGWVWKQFWEIDGVRYHHGDAGRSGQFAPAAYMKAFKQSHVHGHLHGHACVMYEGKHFGVNAGCLIDPTAYAFKYAKNHPLPVNLGCALIFNGESAHFLPMHLDASGRWTGKL